MQATTLDQVPNLQSAPVQSHGSVAVLPIVGKGKKKKHSAKLHHNVYVIELDKAVLQSKDFLAKNPGHDPAKTCLYVGMTGKTPEERFAQHKEGFKSCRFAKKHGLRLRPQLYQLLNPMSFEACKLKEIELAETLRAAGHAVWQN
jgi:predicted GIY-YIG superfamily endonuclease